MYSLLCMILRVCIIVLYTPYNSIEYNRGRDIRINIALYFNFLSYVHTCMQDAQDAEI